MMTSWCKIGHITTSRNLSWLSRTSHIFSSKFCFPKLFTRSTFMPAMRPVFFPHVRSISVTLHMKLVHDGSDSESEEDEMMDFYNEPEVFSVRHLLYPDCEDSLMKQLNECSSVQDVFSFIREHEGDMDGQLVSQAVLVLWDLQNIYYKANAMNLHPSPVISAMLNPYDVLKKYVNAVSAHEDFELLLKFVNQWYQHLSVDALTAVFLYLNKMGVSLFHDVMQNMISRCEEILEDSGEQFTLMALSRFTVTIHSKQGFWPVMISKKTLPYVVSNIETCDNADDIRLLTICLNSIRLLVTEEILTSYKCRVEQFVERRIITEQNSRIITKIVRFLNYPHWSYYNVSTIRKLILVLKGSVSMIAPQDLVALHKIFQTQLEPADMMEEMHDAAAKFLSQAENATIGNNPLALQGTTDLLGCLVTFSLPEHKVKLEKVTHAHVENCSANTLPTLFKLLRDLKTADIQLCDALWSKTLHYLQNMPSEREDYKLLRIAHRYMHFNNNLGGTYRHYELEKHMINWLWNEVENGIAGVIPSKFARVASFVLAYGNIGQHGALLSESMLRKLVEKMLSMAPQIRRMDCLYISKGLKIASFIRHQKRSISQRFVEMLMQIDAILYNCIVRHLQERDLKLSKINVMTKCYINKKQIQDTDLFSQLIGRYERVSGEITSRELRDIASNLLLMNCLVPSVLDSLVDYVVEVNEHMLGETVIKLLYACYMLGYVPTRAEQFFPAAVAVIYRDRERMQGLVLLQAAIALCFFHRLPENLIHFIFTVDFLERLDEEVETCYAKVTYPVRVRHSLMHLNRAVCLDYPETDVPWFHEKFCQQTAMSEPHKSSHLYSDVLRCLVAVTGSEQLVHVRNYSPYFYRIDFQILLNKEKKPVSIKHQADSNISKIAILLWGKDAFTNTVSQLCGEQQLKQRHLEMLGYRVIGISASLWNSMYMSEVEAKTNYLREKIWPSASGSDIQELDSSNSLS